MVLDNLELIIPPSRQHQLQHLPEEPLGNRLLVVGIIRQQSRLTELFGLGVVILAGNLVIFPIQTEVLQSPHLPEEPTGNKLLGIRQMQQQSKLMELYGLGVVGVTEDLELIILETEVLQSPHLPVETIGNRFLCLIDVDTRQQSRPMELCGFGVMVIILELIYLVTQIAEILQSPHLPEETIGNLLLVEVII